ncbi:MurR/RpiR family transcriptional regulator [Corynebacterium sp. FDAARGOS 1242]|uniref:MurR/RpiR family transcriptional regulator n=1 Tax=Corynebacterium TaxID=1716 RepID=UPI000E0FD72B|nr:MULTISPECIES: MurR/RpiR family transcriptional regulator [Corynebacterium]QRP60734.1 MurR/RpiR family transcriptional regulator [Corynebacterium minutissimum]QRP99090.1 MurR/RpiR family transcriptional regulator [Corynebacterium sp. FDAARGOS 1242]
MNFQQRVERHRASLSRADEAVVDVILSRPQEAALWRGEDVAAKAGVHGSAVTRTAKKLGYKGYLELRQELRRMHDQYLAAEHSNGRRAFRNEAGQTVLGQLVSKEMDSLSAASGSVDQHSINRAADLVMNARDIYIYGRGNSIPLCDQTERRFRRLGRSVHDLSGETDHDMAEQLLRMGEPDLLVVFAFRRSTRPLRQLLNYAEAVNCKVLLITDDLRVVHPVPVVTLAAPRGDEGTFTTLSVPMLMLNAIVLSIQRRYEHDVAPFQQKLKNILEGFET